MNAQQADKAKLGPVAYAAAEQQKEKEIRCY